MTFNKGKQIKNEKNTRHQKAPKNTTKTIWRKMYQNKTKNVKKSTKNTQRQQKHAENTHTHKIKIDMKQIATKKSDKNKRLIKKIKRNTTSKRRKETNEKKTRHHQKKKKFTK